jgi:hypothetical protein
VVPADSHGLSRVPHYLGTPPGGSSDFAYRALTFCGRPFHAGSAIRELCNSLTVRQNGLVGPATPTWQRLPPLTPCRFGLFPVRSPLLGESRLFSLPQGTEMFQFPWFPLPALCVQAGVTRHDPCRVSLFGDPRIEACLAAPRGISQPATSFIGFQRLGIHRVPFATCRDDARARYGVLKGHVRIGWRLHGRESAELGSTLVPRGSPADPTATQPQPSKLHSVFEWAKPVVHGAWRASGPYRPRPAELAP